MIKSSLMRPTVRGLVLALAVTTLASFVAQAVPYASSVSQSGSTVSFVLNQPAAGITVLRDGANPVTPAIDATTKGVKTFDMTGFATYSIIVTGNTATGWTKFSDDTFVRSKYYSPRGVTVDTNPKRSTFGRIVVCEGLGGTVAAGGRTTTEGLFIMSADQGDVFNQGDTGYAGGVSWTTSGDSPFKISLNTADPTGQDYTIYITDYINAHSGVWTADGLNPSAAFPELLINTGRLASGIVTNSLGQNVHGNVVSAWVEGVGANRIMFTLDEDLSLGSIFQYDIGTTTSGYDTAPTVRVDDGNVIGNSIMDVIRDEDGSWWMSTYRWSDTAGNPSLSHWADNSTTPLWVSATPSCTLNRAYGCMDIHQYEDLIVIGCNNGTFYLVDILDRDNPKKVATIVHPGATIRDVAFDPAGNVYVVSPSSETLRIYDRGGFTVATTTSDGTFNLFRPTSDVTVAATDASAAEAGPDTATFTITRRFGALDASLQVYFTLSGTATSNVDYTISPTSPATIPAGQTTLDITVTPSDNSTPEPTETVVLTLAAGDYGIGSPGSASATIADDDAVYRYWDSNGATAGAGDPATGTWGTDNFWSTASDGTAATAAWTDGATAVFSAGADAWTPFTVTVNGTLNVGSLAFEEAPVTMQGGTLNYQNVLGIPVTGGNVLIKSLITGSAGLTLDGPSSFGLATNNTYSGPTIINGGNLIVGADGGVIPDGSAVTIGAAGKLFLDDQVFPSGAHSETIGSLAGAAGAEVNVPDTATLTFGGDNTDTLWNGIASGSGSLAKVGTGKTTLGTSGTMPNTLAISGGTISINAAGRISSANPMTIDNGGILESTSDGQGDPFYTGRAVTIGSGGGTLKVANVVGILMVTDVISGPGVLTTDGLGELRTHSVEHTFSKLIVKQGLYTAGHATSLGYNTSFGAIPGSTTADAITIYGGAAIRKAGGQNVTLDPKQGVTLAGAGTKTIRAYAGDANTGTFEITGTISGPGPLQVPGPSDYLYGGRIVLKGQNTYSDGTIVQRGGVYVINSFTGSGTGSGTVTVNNAAVLGGEGNIAGPVVVTGGSLSPGYTYYTGAVPATEVTKAVAKLALASGLDLSAGTCAWQLGALSTANPGTDWDQVELTGGNLTLGGSSVLDVGFTGSATAPDFGTPFWQAAQQWKVIANSGAGSVSGNFASITGTNGLVAGTFTTLADNTGVTLVYTPNAIPPAPATMSSVSVGGGNVTINYSGGVGSQFVLLKSLNVDALLNTWTPVATNATPAGSFVIPVGSDPKAFYCIQSK